MPDWAKDVYDNDDDKQWCRLHVNEIIEQLKNRKNFWSPLHNLIADYFPSNQGVTMRHITRLLAFCNLESMIHAHERAHISFKTKDDQIIKTWVGTLEDLLTTIDIVGNISTVPPEKLKFYDNVFVPLFNDKNSIQEDLTEQQVKLIEKRGLLSSDIQEKFENVFKKPISVKQLSENYLKPLMDEGMIITENDPDNKSRYLYYPASGVSIHNLETLKSTLIDTSTLTKFNNDYVISCLKELLGVSTKIRKSNLVFVKSGNLLNLEGLTSEILRHSSKQAQEQL